MIANYHYTFSVFCVIMTDDYKRLFSVTDYALLVVALRLFTSLNLSDASAAKGCDQADRRCRRFIINYNVP